MKRKRMSPGAVAAEFAIVFPLVLLPLFVATIDLGHLIHTKHVIANAAREGVAVVVRGEANYQTVVGNYVTQAGLDAARVSAGPPTFDPSPPGLGSEVTLRVRLSPYEFPIIPWGELFPNVTAVEEWAVMRYLSRQ